MLKKLFQAALLLAPALCLHAQIAVSELNYHSDSLNSSGDWIELHNYSGAAVNLSGWTLKDGNVLNPAYTFPAGTSIASGGFIVLVENTSKFAAIYPGVSFLGPLPFEFSNNSEQITLRDNASSIKVQFTYGDSVPWSKCADGLGRTLQIINPSGDPNNPANWRCGCVLGSPKADFQPCTGETVVVSEINYNSSLSANAGDWIELRNLSNSGINISGWKLKDQNEFNIFTFPPSTILNPLGRLVVYEDLVLFSARHPSVLNKVGPLPFGFSANGDGIRLYDGSNKIRYSTYYNDNIQWPQGADGNGYTLELDTLFTSADDVCAPSAWFDGCPEGSPGKQFVLCPGFSNEENALSDFLLYPNPASEQLNIEAPQPFSRISVLDANGKLLRDVKAPQEAFFSLPVNDLAPGLYFIRLENAAATALRPFLLSR